jgi:hypothetical protein
MPIKKHKQNFWLENLLCFYLAHVKQQSRLTMMFKIIHVLVDINKTLFFAKGDGRTRSAQRLFQERTTHPALSNRFSPHRTPVE